MTHYFISVYFNYCEYKKRYNLTREFVKRYPNVILIEIAFGNRPFVFSDYKNVIQYRERENFLGG